MARLHMSLWEFYECTPIEINYALNAHFDIVKENAQLTWEQTRTTIYYMYLLSPSKKKKVSYDIFKNEYLHLSFDDEINNKKPAMSDEDFEQIQNFFKKLTKGNQ
jgi:hypothetical protein